MRKVIVRKKPKKTVIVRKKPTVKARLKPKAQGKKYRRTA